MLYAVNFSRGVVQTDDSNRIQFLEGDWQVESVSQVLKKSNDFEDEKQRKTNELLSQLHWKPSTTLSRFMKYLWNFTGSF